MVYLQVAWSISAVNYFKFNTMDEAIKHIKENLLDDEDWTLSSIPVNVPDEDYQEG